VTSARNNLKPLRRLTLVGVVSALLLAVSACGGGDGSGRGAPAKPEAGASLADIQKAGEITVGTEGTYKPFTFHEGGTGDLTGYDVEVMRAVGAKLGVDVKFQETQWDAIFAGLDAGRFDAIANQVSITDERKAKYAFSTPYTVSPGVIVTAKDDNDISSFADLDGKTTAQSLTSNWYELAKDSGAEVQPVEGWAQAVTLLRQGRVDATVNDRLTFLDYANTEDASDLKVAAESDDVAHNAITFRKGSDSLVEAVDKALAELRADGTLAKISEKYFGADVSR
jgi:L-cystine transport system substrate-binding protein